MNAVVSYYSVKLQNFEDILQEPDKHLVMQERFFARRNYR